jgi:PAS domain S-box-containing protein
LNYFTHFCNEVIEFFMQQFEALFEHATVGIIVTDSTGTIINYNALAAEQFGYDRQEILGQKVEILIPRPVREAHLHYRDGFHKNPHPRTMGGGRDLNGQKKNGQTFPVEISLSHYTSDGEQFAIAFIIDITVRKQHEALVIEQRNELLRVSEELKRFNVELEQKVENRTKMLRETLVALERSKQEVTTALEKEKELSELKSRFVTMASHEFRTPLSSILSSLYLLEQYNQNKDEKTEKHIQRIRNSVGDMQSILNDFLSLGRLEEGRVKANIQAYTAEDIETDVRQLIDEMTAVSAGQKVEMQMDKTTEYVFIDKQLLRSILLNFISNAFKFSPKDSEINIKMYLTENLFGVDIVDKGIGISEEDQQHLFERFFRAQNASNIQGTGLGLHIVTKYLELLNGTVSFESKLNEGTTFTVRIPQPLTITEDENNSDN